jgi:lipopolysaccharide transport system ATP-binding protein
MSDLAIQVIGLGKEYRLGNSCRQNITLREKLGDLVRAPLSRMFRDRDRSEQERRFWALEDVSFELRRGDVLGIIGRNGAGKSTLLKILSRITEPTLGDVEIHGRVGSLLEVGTGFHPELTGRENVFLNGAILGMRRSEIISKFDEIVAFAEVEPFIDTPVKHYSSGMYMRLAFSVAAHLEPEILIVDEVLAVGDAQFQKKCLGKMGEVSREGRTVLFVSHNMAAIQSLCNRVCLLRQGRLDFDGPTAQGVARYVMVNHETYNALSSRSGASGPLSFTAVASRLEGAPPNQSLILELELRSSRPHSPAFLAVDLKDELEVTLMQALPPQCLIADAIDHSVRLRIALPSLIPGRYSASLWAGPHNTETYDSVDSAIQFEITTSPVPGRTFPHCRSHGSIIAESVLQICTA